MRNNCRPIHVTAPLAVAAMYALTTLAASAAVGVTVNGSAVDIEPAPIVQAGRAFVPLRGVFEQLGASVVYSNGAIDATGNGRDIALQIGSTQATVNGRSQLIDVAPFIVGASTYVPLRFISEALGDSVSWDDADRIAAIDTGGGSSDYYSPGTPSYVDTAPPQIPAYTQPELPAPNYIWQPGYWGWGQYGYYWVPGTWVRAPQPGYLWTPGYWQGNDSGFHWNPGFWAPAVGYYGGVSYGNGYYGNGYNGGRWSGNAFEYNTYVTRVDTTIVRNVYIDRTVYVDNATTRIGYSGGKYGLRVLPTQEQLAVAKQRHLGMTAVQLRHVKAAESDRRLLASVNHEKPPVLVVARPLSPVDRPAALVPVKASDRVNPLANVAPVRVPVAPAARPLHEARSLRAALPKARVAAMRPVVPAVRAATPFVSAAPAPVYRAHVIHETAPVERPAVYRAPAERAAVYRAPAIYAAAHRTAASSAPLEHVAAPRRAAGSAHVPALEHRAVPPAHEPPHV